MFSNYDYLLYLGDYSNYSFLKFYNNSNFYTKSLITFINQTDDLGLYDNLENITSVYHYSVPNVKLAYPEPFIASPSFMHTDLWFVHILVYQYWLWFVFIFIIVFFFLTFLCTLRWCNMRVRPRRETRGVSRSKCGDLITATVPVTWATSIIVNESTDAIDYYDGFGTTELVVGIRAYQWGWEYYYPKDIDLNYNIKPSYSTFVGNSLKYVKSSDTVLKTNNLWKYYQNKNNDQIVTPAHFLVLPIDNYKLLNFLNFNDLGSSSTHEINAFKKIRMFSKIYTSNLSYIPNNFSFKYKSLSSLFINDSNITDSYLYGLKRQHNFLSSNSLLNNQSTFLNSKSFNKIINFNFKNNTKLKQNSLNYNFKNFFKKSLTLDTNTSNTMVINLFKNTEPASELIFFKNSLIYSNFVSSINDNSDKIKFNYPIYKFFNVKNKTNHFYNYNNINQLNTDSDLILLDSNNSLSNSFFNYNVSYKTINLFSNNQSIPLSNRYLRNFLNTSLSDSNYNYSLNLNTLNDYLINYNSSFGFNNNFFATSLDTNWINPISSHRRLSAHIFFDYPYSAVISNNPSTNVTDYDNLNKTNIADIPTVLQGKEESTPLFLSNLYWNFYWSNSNPNLKTFSSLTYHDIHNSFYLPMFNFYYDYDFRNWQALELMEDSFWESICSIYTYDEYVSLAKDFYDFEYFDKFTNFYNQFNKNNVYKNKILHEPFFKNTAHSSFYGNSVYLDDYAVPSNLIATKDFHSLPLFSASSQLDESYESLKYLNYFFNKNNKIFLIFSTNNFYSYAYSSVFDAFRTDCEDFSWFIDENNSNNIDELNDYNVLRFNNSLNLRAPVKNSIITYNAIQKVFKTRFDEGRSNTKLNDFANFYVKQPFISSSRINYENILGKTKENFFNVNFYKNKFQNYFNSFYDAQTSLNFYFFDFPFLLALKSDASRYLWFDWFAKWGFYEVQPSSSSRYAIYGMPYFVKNFDFNSSSNEMLNETETYLLRLSRARRNYLPNWTYTPYFYARNASWYKNNLLFNALEQRINDLNVTYYFLNLMAWYWNNLYFVNYHNFLFNPSNSGINSYTKLNWKPQSSIQSYYYNISALTDILTKREYLYREFLANKNKIINLPFYLTNNPSNPLINDIKASFFFLDPINLNNEYSRDLYYNSLGFFNFTVIKSYLKTTTNFLNLSLLNDYLFYYFFNNNEFNDLRHNSELYKNQYRPMRKGISNMIRLHATGAIALPIEIRLQVLASSKDVIHSWAIPSAGIKIDCVPGYSSHKVMIFLVSGIFWGQCMEICGRYHHWMPIVVYFMKRDLFFLWCTHFVFLTGSNNMWNINDRQYTDYVKTISFDKYSWLSELSN